MKKQLFKILFTASFLLQIGLSAHARGTGIGGGTLASDGIRKIFETKILKEFLVQTHETGDLDLAKPQVREFFLHYIEFIKPGHLILLRNSLSQLSDTESFDKKFEIRLFFKSMLDAYVNQNLQHMNQSDMLKVKSLYASFSPILANTFVHTYFIQNNTKLSVNEVKVLVANLYDFTSPLTGEDLKASYDNDELTTTIVSKFHDENIHRLSRSDVLELAQLLNP